MRTVNFADLKVTIDRNSKVWFKGTDENIFKIVLQVNPKREFVESYPDKGSAIKRKNRILKAILAERGYK